MMTLREAVAKAIDPDAWNGTLTGFVELKRMASALTTADRVVVAVRAFKEAERKAKLKADDEAFQRWSAYVTNRIKNLGANVDRNRDGRERTQL